jgi:hypothetical protein
VQNVRADSSARNWGEGIIEISDEQAHAFASGYRLIR